jgi:predicted DNA binding CopG/RHH family protein
MRRMAMDKTKEKRKEQLAVQVSREKIMALKIYAAKNRTNVSAVIRELIDNFLEKTEIE